MDIYHALGLDVPELQLCLSLLASEAETGQTVKPFLEELRGRLATLVETLQGWSEEQYGRYAQEMAQRLGRLSLLAEGTTAEQAAQALQRDLRRLGGRLGAGALLGCEGPVLVSWSSDLAVTDPSSPIATPLAAGQRYLKALAGATVAAGYYEIWFRFRSALHFDILSRLIDSWPAALRGDREEPAEQETGPSLPAVCAACAYQLIYQLGDDLLAAAPPELATRVVSLAFPSAGIDYSTIRQEVMALLEQLAEQPFLRHASFWQRYPWPGPADQAFLLRLRLPAGEVPLRQIMAAIAAAGPIGRDILSARGRLLSGRRLL
jgi:hypothetical protein